MTCRLRLPPGQHETANTLTHCVRVATGSHLRRLPQNADKSASWIAKQLRRLRRLGLIEHKRMAMRLFAVDRPLFTWEPGTPPPNYGALVWQFEKRLRALKPQVVTVYWATRRAADMFGGTAPRLGHGGQFEHDLGLTEVYLARARHDLDSVACWIGEDLLRQRFSGPLLRRVPDAAISGPDGTITTFIEFCRQYPVKKLKGFHAHCRRHAIGYELW